jgi:hypothetical protein
MLAITPLFFLLLHLVTLTDAATVPGAPIPPRRSRFARKAIEIPTNATIEQEQQQQVNLAKRATTTTASDPWATQKNFDWSAWTGWGFYDHNLDYVKQWYYAR